MIDEKPPNLQIEYLLGEKLRGNEAKKKFRTFLLA